MNEQQKQEHNAKLATKARVQAIATEQADKASAAVTAASTTAVSMVIPPVLAPVKLSAEAMKAEAAARAAKLAETVKAVPSEQIASLLECYAEAHKTVCEVWKLEGRAAVNWSIVLASLPGAILEAFPTMTPAHAAIRAKLEKLSADNKPLVPGSMPTKTDGSPVTWGAVTWALRQLLPTKLCLPVQGKPEEKVISWRFDVNEQLIKQTLQPVASPRAPKVPVAVAELDLLF